MKKIILFLTVSLMGIYSTHAQMGRYGTFDNQRSSPPRGPELETQKEDPKTAEELVADQMPRITEALDLNDFEQAVVSSILNKYVQQRIELQILELPEDKAREAYEKIAENQKAELEQGLPAEKYEAFMELMENGGKSKKGKKDRKKKKKT
jgi:tRNA A37 N6-isopentenylltransferase MiaA